MSDKFYITTTLPYINSEPHIGFAAEIIKADVIARYQRFLGKEVIFNTGTDEHGLKIYRQAQEKGLDTKEFCDKVSASFKSLQNLFNLSCNRFIRTTDKKHIEATQKFWQVCLENGDIYKKKYAVKYCVGCELEKTDSELEDNHCPFHPNLDLEIIEEENYFFRFSKYQDKLLQYYTDNPGFVQPEFKFNEIKSFVKRGLRDFSISRLKEKMPWGVPIPSDDSQVMYVWFDALINYISTLNWPKEEEFTNFWPGVQVAGKDNLKQQTAMWPAMLFSASILPPKKVLIFGFLTNEGKKISKSMGNSLDLNYLVDKYGSSAIRYYLLSAISTFSDGDFSEDRLKKVCNADLANGLGNLSSRLANLIEKANLSLNLKFDDKSEVSNKFKKLMDNFELQEAISLLWQEVDVINLYLSQKAPWKEEDPEKKAHILKTASIKLINISPLIALFLPEIGEKLVSQFIADKITKQEALFLRL
jgi:methionyl-tRNA synthetase